MVKETCERKFKIMKTVKEFDNIDDAQEFICGLEEKNKVNYTLVVDVKSK